MVGGVIAWISRDGRRRRNRRGKEGEGKKMQPVPHLLDFWLVPGAHVVGPLLPKVLVALTVMGLDNKTCREDVGQLGTVAVATT